MPTESVLALHDNGRWWPARADGSWRVVVTYSVAPGMRYIRAEPADRYLPVDDPPPGWVDPRQDVRTRPAQMVTPSGASTGADQPPW